MIKTAEYKSKSYLNKTFQLPQECVKETDHIMKYILRSRGPNDLVKLINENKYFGNMDIFTRQYLLQTARNIADTRGTSLSLQFQDAFYIKTGIYESCKIREKVNEISESLQSALNTLEELKMEKGEKK